MTAAVENNIAMPQKKKKNQDYNNTTSVSIPKRNESKNFNRYLYIPIYSNIIHNSQNVEETQVPNDG